VYPLILLLYGIEIHDLENNVILIKGSVPGPKNSLVLVRTSVKTGDKVKDIISSFIITNNFLIFL